MIKLKHLLREEDTAVETKKWSAVVLDSTSRDLLIREYKSQIPLNWKIIAHHMTINPFGPTDSEGTRVALKVISIGLDDKALAVKVIGYDGKTNNAFPHITIAINSDFGAKPKDSNNIQNWEKVENGLQLYGTVKNL
jgi:hypothetical protein